MKKPKPIPLRRLSTISMVSGGEKKISKVIQHHMVMEWVGIGWIPLRKATAQDYSKIPQVKS